MVFANNANITLLISLTVLSNQVSSYYNMDTLHQTCPFHSAINMRKTYNLYTDSGISYYGHHWDPCNCPDFIEVSRLTQG